MENPNYRPVSMQEWLVTGILMCIPIVNIVLLFVWAFGNNAPISKKNWAMATLLWFLIVFVIFLILSALGISIEQNI
jgi:hypothetical protein